MQFMLIVSCHVIFHNSFLVTLSYPSLPCLLEMLDAFGKDFLWSMSFSSSSPTFPNQSFFPHHSLSCRPFPALSPYIRFPQLASPPLPRLLRKRIYSNKSEWMEKDIQRSRTKWMNGWLFNLMNDFFHFINIHDIYLPIFVKILEPEIGCQLLKFELTFTIYWLHCSPQIGKGRVSTRKWPQWKDLKTISCWCVVKHEIKTYLFSIIELVQW